MTYIGLINTLQAILLAVAVFILFNIFQAVSRLAGKLGGVSKNRKDLVAELRKQRHEYKRPFVLLDHDTETNTVTIANSGSYPAVGLEYEEFTNQLLSFAQKINFLAAGASMVVQRTVSEPPDAIGILYYGHERNLEYSSKLVGRDLLMKTSVPR